MNSKEQLELGKLYCDRGDFDQAIQHLEQALSVSFSEKNFADYLKAQNYLLRIYAERNDLDKISQVKEILQDLVLKENVELTPRTYYTLGLCASYRGQHEIAVDYLNKALSLAMSKNLKEDICYALTGLAIVHCGLGQFDLAKKEIENLDVFFEVLKIPDLQLASLQIKVLLLKSEKQYEEALGIVWKCYDLVRETKNIPGLVATLLSIGTMYIELGDRDMAKLYLQLAARSVDRKNFSRLAKKVEDALSLIGEDMTQSYDMVFDIRNHTVVEKKLGKIDFKNQFILLDLLRLFAQNQGMIYSKEFLVENVWKQEYDPSVHDNKIYVTIKRLRKMIEPDYEKPKYIFRAKNGYYLNKTAKILIEN